MFYDARRPQAGMLVDRNPFAGLGLRRSKGRKNMQPPDQATVARMIAAADELTPPIVRRVPADRVLVGRATRRA